MNGPILNQLLYQLSEGLPGVGRVALGAAAGTGYLQQMADALALIVVNAIASLGGRENSPLQTDLFAGVTLAEVITSGLFIVLVVLVNSLILKRVRRRVLAKQADGDPKSWRLLIVEAVSRPLFLTVWIYGIYFAVSPLIVHFQAGDTEHPARVLFDRLFDFGLFLAFFWVLYRFTRVFEVRLELWASGTEGALDDLLVPLIARGLRISMPIIAIMFALPLLNLPPEFDAVIRKGSSILIIAAVAWIICQAVFLGEKVIMGRFDLAQADNLRARQVYTQVTVLKKTALFVIGVFTIGSILMVFEEVRRFGTSILASAGVVGIIFGFAAQRTIANLFAGFQIAMTQPIRIDDVVIVESEWGRIEEITLTYVVVRIWDARRLVVPINYFIERPFQNWTRVSADILGTVMIYADYTVPVEEIRKEFRRLAEQSANWDKRVCGVQVTNATERTVELRGLVSAADASKAWDLRCELREKMIDYLQRTHPQCLPRIRAITESAGSSARPAPEAAAGS
jgi:small-conductance mechanosensitive channel